MYVPSDEEFHLLRAFPFETCLFPKLLSLSWVVIFTRYLHFFLSPRLRICYIAIVQPELPRDSIGTRCAALENLDIETMGVMALAPHLSETVRSCKALVRLQCPPLDSAAWKHLSTVPTLRNVAIRQENVSNPPSKLDTHELSLTTFLNITTLHFCYAPIADITAIIQHSEFLSLRQFKFVAHILPGVELLPLLQALSQCKACHTLESIAISDDDPEDEESPGSNTFAVTRELLCFTQLRTLRLHIHCSINPDNVIFMEAMSSWPQLRSLLLFDLHRRPPKVTLPKLFAALSLCPHLHTLHVGVDVMNIDIDPKAMSFQHTSLKNMGAYPSRTADAEAVARIIFAALPNVHLANTWGDVNTHLKSLKASSSLQGEDGD
ncbi:hypothetical protein EV702DRAFT_1283849 [Suillus placidus]|uniref:F-box domain-containing protein n=1 Tax=Suillus placidus TaxID=48579 RepID=A0A9P7CVJ7_9AGAM|nr:hypothetical protein EV702DRAFT_1283849 [Suillus placidus]